MLRLLPVLLILAACGSAPMQQVAQPTMAAAPSATEAAVPTIAPSPTAPPAPTLEPSQRYLEIARGAALPLVRPNLPKGEWKATLRALDDVSITMPLGVALDKEQFVRQAKRTMQAVVKAVFDGAPELNVINLIGTTPDGTNQEELPAVSIVVERTQLATWDGTPDTLTTWNISPRYQ